MALPPLDTQQDLALAVVGEAMAEGEITSEQAMHMAHLVDAARRTIDARNAEFREKHFWSRQRSPAPLPPAEADPDRTDAARG